MINKVFRVFAVIAAFVAAQTGWAADDVISYDGFTFDMYLNNNYHAEDWSVQAGKDMNFTGAVLVNTNGKKGQIVVPAYVPYNGQDIPVVGISGNESTFYGHAGINMITFPGTVRVLENNSLREMPDLNILIFEDGDEELWMGYSPCTVIDEELTYGSNKLNSVTIGRNMVWKIDDDEPFEAKEELWYITFTEGCTHIGIPGIDNTDRSLFNCCPNIYRIVFEDSDKPLYVEYYGLYTKDAWADRHQWNTVYIGRDIQYPGWDSNDNTAWGDGYSPFYKLGNTEAEVTIGPKVKHIGSYMFYDSYNATLRCEAEEVSVNNFAFGYGDHSDGIYLKTVVLDQDTYTGGTLTNTTANKLIIKPSFSNMYSASFGGTYNFDDFKVDSVIVESSDKALNINYCEFNLMEANHFVCYRPLVNIGLTTSPNVNESYRIDGNCTKIDEELFSYMGITQSPVIYIGKNVKEIGMFNPGLGINHDPSAGNLDKEEIIEYYKDMKVPTIVFEAESIEDLPQITSEHLLWNGETKLSTYCFTGFMEQVPVYLHKNIDPSKLDKNKWNCKNFKVWDPENGDITGIESVDSEAHDGTAADSHRRGIYTLTGVRLQAPQKGLNIINGKKVVIK